MKYIIFLLFFLTSSFYVKAQDTLYVKFTKNEKNAIIKGFRHKMDTSNIYPFDGGRIYVIQKKVGKFNKDLSFSFISYTPEWMDQQFKYHLVDRSILFEKDFKDSTWFDRTDYYEILKIFNGSEKVIYLVDEGQIKDNAKIYMVRVYFSHTVEE